MNLNEVELLFMRSTDEQCKRFLKHNMRRLAKRNLLGHFYKLYAQKTHKKTEVIEDDPYQILHEPLAYTIGGDLDD